MAIEATFTLPFGRSHTPRTCLLRSVSVVLYRSLNKDWNVEEERRGDGVCENVSVFLRGTVSKMCSLFREHD